MPNQRKKSKRYVCAWIDEKLDARLKKVASDLDRDKSWVINQLLVNFLKKPGNRL